MFLDEAQFRFDEYITHTLAGSLTVGGRFNPRGEFGAIYTASDEETAWEEVASRFRKQGVLGLPPNWGMLRVVITRGCYVDLTVTETREALGARHDDLIAQQPSAAQQGHCWRISRKVRGVTDVLIAASARASGKSMVVYPDRAHSELDIALITARRASVPAHLTQPTAEPW